MKIYKEAKANILISSIGRDDCPVELHESTREAYNLKNKI